MNTSIKYGFGENGDWEIFGYGDINGNGSGYGFGFGFTDFRGYGYGYGYDYGYGDPYGWRWWLSKGIKDEY